MTGGRREAVVLLHRRVAEAARGPGAYRTGARLLPLKSVGGG